MRDIDLGKNVLATMETLLKMQIGFSSHREILSTGKAFKY